MVVILAIGAKVSSLFMSCVCLAYRFAIKRPLHLFIGTIKVILHPMHYTHLHLMTLVWQVQNEVSYSAVIQSLYVLHHAPNRGGSCISSTDFLSQNLSLLHQVCIIVDHIVIYDSLEWHLLLCDYILTSMIFAIQGVVALVSLFLKHHM